MSVGKLLVLLPLAFFIKLLAKSLIAWKYGYASALREVTVQWFCRTFPHINIPRRFEVLCWVLKQVNLRIKWKFIDLGLKTWQNQLSVMQKFHCPSSFFMWEASTKFEALCQRANERWGIAFSIRSTPLTQFCMTFLRLHPFRLDTIGGINISRLPAITVTRKFTNRTCRSTDCRTCHGL